MVINPQEASDRAERQQEDFSLCCKHIPHSRRLASLQADPPEPQVEEERGGLCQMEINTENPWSLRAGGEGFWLLLKVYIGHRCLGDSVGPALCHTWVDIC